MRYLTSKYLRDCLGCKIPIHTLNSNSLEKVIRITAVKNLEELKKWI